MCTQNRLLAINAIAERTHGNVQSARPASLASYGEDVFNTEIMCKYLPKATAAKLLATIQKGTPLDSSIADAVAYAMKEWAISRGATHFTHWFQPLTGGTAEKHDAFLELSPDGKALMRFSGKNLTIGEPDASSFPSGGLRSTFEARGYTAWDPTSPAFIKESAQGATLCIPTILCGYHGEALDKKTPLLRSLDALSRQVCRLGKLFGLVEKGRPIYATLGAEQEYFLIDKKLHAQRLDLLQTGRTLFGRKPAKHQQMEDHYFGAIKPRVMAFMCELDRTLWRLGVPAKTRHNEACPGQFEIAPVYEEINLAVDHNMLLMEVLHETAAKHGFACLLHEKPFAGVSGSGKHNNWSIVGPDGKNWLAPGDNPHENAKFLIMIGALMQAVDRRANVLRATVATAGNDHRLGANEAPPAIISIFLGEQLTDIITQLEQGAPQHSKKAGLLQVGLSALPNLPRDATDRNRTSPFAFTGNKFEFRAVGASQSCAGSNVALNIIVAEALDDICTRLEKAVAAGQDFHEALQALLRDIVKKHKRIIFNGDNYSAAWRQEAARRGLPNVPTTPQALGAFIEPDVIALFAKYGVLSERELRSRYEVYLDIYHKTVTIEAECALTIARTLIVPAALHYEGQLARTLKDLMSLKLAPPPAQQKLLAALMAATELLLQRLEQLEAVLARPRPSAALRALAALREVVDQLEGLLPDQQWPLPSYAEMLFML